MTRKTLLALAAATTILAGYGPLHAQQGNPHQGHGQPAQSMPGHQGKPQGHTMHQQGHGAQIKGDASPASAAFRAANDKMHKDMDITFTGDADVDFARGMIAHHQGAIDMAKITLAFGKDPEIRKLAQEIISAQEKEIAFMRDWLKKTGK
jgi:uncharacterized protein (DUF305 family)